MTKNIFLISIIFSLFTFNLNANENTTYIYTLNKKEIKISIVKKQDTNTNFYCEFLVAGREAVGNCVNGEFSGSAAGRSFSGGTCYLIDGLKYVEGIADVRAFSDYCTNQ